MLVRAAVLLLALAAMIAAPAAGAAGAIESAVAALREQPVYVDPGAERSLSAADAPRLQERIATAGGGPIYIAVLPAAARDEAGGSASEVLRMLHSGLAREGTYAVVVGGQFRAASTDMPAGEAGTLATQAFEAHHDEGVAATLLDFVDRVGSFQRGEAPSGGGGSDGGGGSGAGLIALLAAVGAGLGFFAWRGHRRRSADFAEVKKAAQEDLLALGDDITALDIDIEMPKTPQEAKDDYARALDQYQRAEQLLDRARSPEDLEPVTAALEEGRFAMASAKARLDGKPPPERRPPCFFNPRHGPSARDVEWAPPGGAARLVPACEADAERVEQGLDPDAREIRVNGRAVPYWDAPRAYAPWAGGYFSGFSGLLPAILFGSLLSGALAPPAQIDVDPGVPVGPGDFGGGIGGDFGGGDFGGGGGGDFG